jgi:TetR/AcrR family transcriptional regulator
MTSTRLAERSSATVAPRPAGASRPGVRGQILEAALAEFAEKGFQEASLAAIARRLGVTAPLVLYHFGSKANLWREALEVFCASFAAVVDEAIAETGSMDGRDALRLVVRRLVRFFATNRAACRVLRDEGGVEGGHSEWFASNSLRPVIGRIEAIYRRAVEEGAVRPAPFHTTFFMILGAASCYLESRGLAAQLFGAADEGDDWIDGYAEQVVGLCFDGLSLPVRRLDANRPMLAALRAAATRPATTTATTAEAAL